MKPNFLAAPDLWTRASRTYTTPAEYASALHVPAKDRQFILRGHTVVGFVAAVLGFVVLVAIGAGLL